MKILSLPLEVSETVRSTFVVDSVCRCLVELIHNSLDSSCKHVTAEVSLMNFTVRVSDDGCGISKDNMNIICTRNATSKSPSDGLMTFGYRGEALASLSKVSKIEIVSKSIHALTTYKRSADGWVELDKTNFSPSGTIVSLKDLFYNIPVRRKSLNGCSEWYQIKRELEALILACPMVTFTLIEMDRKKRTVLKSEGIHGNDIVDSHLKKFNSLFGILVDDAFKFDQSDGRLSVSGFIVTDVSINRTFQFVLVNKRLISQTWIHDLINSSYESKNLKLVPAFYVELICPYEDVDFHFDPAKTKCQFKYHRKVTDLIANALGIKLKPDGRQDTLVTSNVRVNEFPILTKKLKDEEKSRMRVSSLKKTCAVDQEPFKIPSMQIRNISRETYCQNIQLNISTEQVRESLVVLGQLDNKFILCRCQSESGVAVILIDQHAADERVQLETRWKAIFKKVNHFRSFLFESTQLETGLVIQLNKREHEIVSTYSHLFSQWGINVNTKKDMCILEGLPDFALKRGQYDLKWTTSLLKRYISQICSTDGSLKQPVSKETINKVASKNDNAIFQLQSLCPIVLVELLQSNACRNAIMFGDSLSQEQCKELIRKLSRCKLPFQCAHGRPSMVPILIL